MTGYLYHAKYHTLRDTGWEPALSDGVIALSYINRLKRDGKTFVREILGVEASLRDADFMMDSLRKSCAGESFRAYGDSVIPVPEGHGFFLLTLSVLDKNNRPVGSSRAELEGAGFENVFVMPVTPRSLRIAGTHADPEKGSAYLEKFNGKAEMNAHSLSAVVNPLIHIG